MKRLAYFDCPYCKRSELYLSACKVWWERLLWVALLKAVRCHHCMRRSYTLFFIPGRHSEGSEGLPYRYRERTLQRLSAQSTGRVITASPSGSCCNISPKRSLRRFELLWPPLKRAVTDCKQGVGMGPLFMLRRDRDIGHADLLTVLEHSQR